MNVVGHIRPAAARRGHDMVMAPHLLCYYDYRQDLPDDPFQYIGGHVPLEKAYSFDPCDGVASGLGNGKEPPDYSRAGKNRRAVKFSEDVF